MEVVSEPNTVSDCIKTFFDDPQWLEDIEHPQSKHTKRRTS